MRRVGRSGRVRVVVAASVASVVVACSPTDSADAPPPPLASPLPTVGFAAPPDAAWMSTVPASGNRAVSVEPGRTRGAPVHTQVELATPAAWLVSVPLDDGTVLHAVTDGTDQVAVVAGVAPDVAAISAERVDPAPLGTPPTGRPALAVEDGAWTWLPAVSGSNGEPAVPTPGGGMAYVDDAGAVHIDGIVRGDDALPDARLAVSADGRVAWPAGPTDRYGHGVLGDGIEAERVVVHDTATGDGIETDLGVRVVEGTGVLWGDLDGDGTDDLVLTASGDGEGARLTVLLAAGPGFSTPPIGTNNRWRHQLGIAATPDGHAELVEIVTPHLARIATWWRIDEDGFTQVAAVDRAVASHRIGSRNLDAAVLVDVTGDGRVEVVGPGPDGGLVAAGGDGSITTLLDDGVVVSNVTATVTPGHVQVGAITADRVLHVWDWSAR